MATDGSFPTYASTYTAQQLAEIWEFEPSEIEAARLSGALKADIRAGQLHFSAKAVEDWLYAEMLRSGVRIMPVD